MTKQDLIFKLSEIKKSLMQVSAGVFLISSEVTRLWLLGFESTAGIVLCDGKSISLFIDDRYYLGAKKQLQSCQEIIQVIRFENLDQIKDHIDQKGYKKILFESNFVTVKQLQIWQDAFDGLWLVPYDSTNWRIQKTNSEIALMQKAADIACLAINTLKSKVLKVGMTEKEVANWITNFMLEQGASKNSFDPIVAFGKNAALPHHQSGQTKLQSNDLILVDIGCIYQGYCSDITRTFFIGKPSSIQQKMFDVVLKANQEGIKALKVGIATKQIDAICRQVIADHSDWKDQFIHNTGHGVGIQIHEEPRLSPFDPNLLSDGCIITVEPGVYLPEIGGIRIEDSVVVTKNGVIVLTKSCPKENFIWK